MSERVRAQALELPVELILTACNLTATTHPSRTAEDQGATVLKQMGHGLNKLASNAIALGDEGSGVVVYVIQTKPWSKQVSKDMCPFTRFLPRQGRLSIRPCVCVCVCVVSIQPPCI